MSKPRPKAILDALDAVSDDSDASSGSGSEKEEEAPVQPAKKQKISLEDLQQHGYQAGPSVLYMKPPQEEPEGNWAWWAAAAAAAPAAAPQSHRLTAVVDGVPCRGDGKAQKSKEDAEESYEVSGVALIRTV